MQKESTKNSELQVKIQKLEWPTIACYLIAKVSLNKLFLNIVYSFLLKKIINFEKWNISLLDETCKLEFEL